MKPPIDKESLARMAENSKPLDLEAIERHHGWVHEEPGWNVKDDCPTLRMLIAEVRRLRAAAAPERDASVGSTAVVASPRSLQDQEQDPW